MKRGEAAREGKGAQFKSGRKEKGPQHLFPDEKYRCKEPTICKHESGQEDETTPRERMSWDIEVKKGKELFWSKKL